MNQFVWRKMRDTDVTAVTDVANSVHPDFPEDISVFQDRFDLYPAGCFVLENDNNIVGYGISHPWALDEAPALNSLLEVLPPSASSYYLHDVALSEKARSGGNASKLLKLMVQQAQDDGFDAMALVAVNGSRPFWERQGFSVRDVAALAQKLKSYSDDAHYMVRFLKNI
ncbi:ribosomal protein S18 acetylase RimI-like enzyme [Paenochrobactrum gallinarii]|uniref:Ribosomal protein S18 acetylase RimI-like enzyme n=2 Tax=Paenochrobactrum gallinarii TaxID=643673 RepID=A0A841LXM4_9HYPH|nr:ribosomal protein S18 acetylase RimI-like enzyme [Paenochrobactrum gallinarii]